MVKTYNNRRLTLSAGAWYDNAARSYDPITQRFLQPDPLAEKYPNLSQYAHCANNTLRFVDLDRKDWTKGYYYVRTERTKLLTTPGPEYVEALKSNNADDVVVSNGAVSTVVGIAGAASVAGKIANAINNLVNASETLPVITKTTKTPTSTVKPSSPAKGARFIGDTDGKVVDTQATPKGSYTLPTEVVLTYCRIQIILTSKPRRMWELLILMRDIAM